MSASTKSLWGTSQTQRFQQDGITASLGAEQSFSSSILIVPRPASTVKTRVWEGKEKSGGKEPGRAGDGILHFFSKYEYAFVEIWAQFQFTYHS